MHEHEIREGCTIKAKRCLERPGEVSVDYRRAPSHAIATDEANQKHKGGC